MVMGGGEWLPMYQRLVCRLPLGLTGVGAFATACA